MDAGEGVSLRVRILTWNLNGRVRDLTKQVEFVCKQLPDLVVLQEVTRSTYDLLSKGLVEGGLTHILQTATQAKVGPRKFGLLVASKWPMREVAHVTAPLWGERLQVAEVSAENSQFRIINTHIPPGSTNKEIKVPMLEAAYAEAMASASICPTILAGDFNAPQEEGSDGLITWAQTKRKDSSWRLIRTRGERWDTAERNCFCGDLQDAFRITNGDIPAHSWVLRHRDLQRFRRFDHVLVSPDWVVVAASYLGTALDNRLSDHAPLLVELEFAPAVAETNTVN